MKRQRYFVTTTLDSNGSQIVLQCHNCEDEIIAEFDDTSSDDSPLLDALVAAADEHDLTHVDEDAP